MYYFEIAKTFLRYELHLESFSLIRDTYSCWQCSHPKIKPTLLSQCLYVWRQLVNQTQFFGNTSIQWLLIEPTLLSECLQVSIQLVIEPNSFVQ